ncbi:hypothetical protein NXV03_22560 [Phocaeicola vulgatus]|nr:hypothetical protein [Phocaeicola vulgatus]
MRIARTEGTEVSTLRNRLKLNLMAEYDARTMNIGAEYSFWKDYINVVIELNRRRYFSGGLVFKVHLKE